MSVVLPRCGGRGGLQGGAGADPPCHRLHAGGREARGNNSLYTCLCDFHVIVYIVACVILITILYSDDVMFVGLCVCMIRCGSQRA